MKMSKEQRRRTAERAKGIVGPTHRVEKDVNFW